MSIHISKDGQKILSTGEDGSIKLWERKGGKEFCKFESHSSSVREAVFHPTNETRW